MNRTGMTRAVLAGAFLLSVPFVVSTVQAQACSGGACRDASLKLVGGCVWAENDGPKAVTLTVRVGTETFVLPLEGADMAKAKPREPSPEDVKQARQCDSVMKSMKLFETMRASGNNIPYNAEIDGRAPFCRKLLADKEKPAGAPAGVHTTIYDVLTSRERAVYRARIRPANCVANLKDVASYTADYEAAPQNPAK